MHTNKIIILIFSICSNAFEVKDASYYAITEDGFVKEITSFSITDKKDISINGNKTVIIFFNFNDQNNETIETYAYLNAHGTLESLYQDTLDCRRTKM